MTLARKRLKSPTTSVYADRTRSPSPARRSKGRHNTPADKSTSDFPARPTEKTKGRFWNENDPIPTRNLPAQPAPQQHPRQSRRRENQQATNQTVEEEDPSVNKMIGQPETRPISREQLVAEVKGIYAGLALAESKCIETERSPTAEKLKAMELIAKELTAKELETTGVRSLLNKSYKARERRYLPLKINCKPAHALLDSGASDNVICEHYAQAIGAVIERPSSKHHFANAIKSPFESVGTTTLTFSISEDRIETSRKSEWTCSFAVVQHLAAPLVLGNQFLRETGALANFAHLMVRKTLSVMSDKFDQFRKVWRFMHMNLPTQKLGCSIDAEPAFAALDSGSDIDVVSLSYAKLRDWQIEPLPEDEGYVLLANNELVKLAGYVDTTLGIRGGCIPRRLYVLDGLVCDVVLGDPTIEALDIFNEFQSSLVETTAAEEIDLFCNIQCVDKIKQIEHEVDQLLAEPPGIPFVKMGRNWWKFFLPKRGASGKEKSTDDEGKQTLN